MASWSSEVDPDPVMASGAGLAAGVVGGSALFAELAASTSDMSSAAMSWSSSSPKSTSMSTSSVSITSSFVVSSSGRESSSVTGSAGVE